MWRTGDWGGRRWYRWRRRHRRRSAFRPWGTSCGRSRRRACDWAKWNVSKKIHTGTSQSSLQSRALVVQMGPRTWFYHNHQSHHYQSHHYQSHHYQSHHHQSHHYQSHHWYLMRRAIMPPSSWRFQTDLDAVCFKLGPKKQHQILYKFLQCIISIKSINNKKSAHANHPKNFKPKTFGKNLARRVRKKQMERR